MINLSRSSYYYESVKVTEEEIKIMNLIDRIYTKRPFYGIRKITEELKRQGELVNHKRVGRLMRQMGIQALFPKRNLSKPNKGSSCISVLAKRLKSYEKQSGLEYRYNLYSD